jgi:hypothetical protein
MAVFYDGPPGALCEVDHIGRDFLRRKWIG